MCADEGVAPETFADNLLALQEQSLLIRSACGEDTRYSMLEPLREYGIAALAKLSAEEAANEESEVARYSRRHGSYFLQLAEQAEPHLKGAEQTLWFRKLDREHANFQAALVWARTQDVLMGMRLAGTLWRYWLTCGHYAEGSDWLQHFLDNGPDLPSAARAKALHGAGSIAQIAASYGNAVHFFSEALAIRRALGDPQAIALALASLGNAIAMESSDTAHAERVLEESLVMFRRLSDERHIAITLGNLARLASERGDHQQGRIHLEATLHLLRTQNDEQQIIVALNNLAGTLITASTLLQHARC